MKLRAVVVFFLTLITSTEFAVGLPEFRSLAARELVLRIDRSLANAQSESSRDIAGIQKAHLALHQPGELQGNEPVRLKWMHAHWVLGMRAALLQQIDSASDIPSFQSLLREWMLLGLELDEPVVQALDEAAEKFFDFETKRGLSELLATLGNIRASRPILKRLAEEMGTDFYLKLAGPELMVPIPNMLHSKYGADEWMKDVRHADYMIFEDGSVLYRGLHLRPGDILVVDHRSFMDGINTCFSQPRSCATHSFQFELLERSDPKTGKTHVYPAVFEIHERGFRVVPLETALSPEFIYWGRVVRPLEPLTPKERAQNIEKLLKDKDARYDFTVLPARMESPHKVSCSTAVDLVCLYEGAEETRLRVPRSEVPEKTQPMLRSMDLDFTEYLTPTDFLRAKLPQVGMINNMTPARFWDNLSRELVLGSSDGAPGSFGDIISHGAVDQSRLGLDFRVLEWVANYLQTHRGPIARAIAYIAGPGLRNFPVVPPKALAYIVGTQKRFELLVRAVRDILSPEASAPSFAGSLWMGGPLRGRKVIREMRQSCSEEIAQLAGAPFDLSAFENDPKFRGVRDRALAPIAEKFPR